MSLNPSTRDIGGFLPKYKDLVVLDYSEWEALTADDQYMIN